MRDALTIELEQMLNNALDAFEANSKPKRKRTTQTNRPTEPRVTNKPLRNQLSLFQGQEPEDNPVLNLSRESRHFDERMLNDTTTIVGRLDDISAAVQPSETPGFAYVSVLSSDDCIWSDRPIRRDAVGAWLEMNLPLQVQLSWEFIESAQRATEPLFKLDEVAA